MPIVQFPSEQSPSPPLPRATVEAVSSPALDPTLRLNIVLEELSRAQLELERARFEIDELPPNSSEDLVEYHLRKQRAAYRRWFEIQQQATALESEARRRQLESIAQFQSRFSETRDDLMDQYADLGPQYRLLVERASAIDARIHVMEQSGRDLSPTELSEMYKLHLSLMNQLQRYTEATKTESLTRQTQETIQQLMIIIEHRVSPSNPQLWRDIVHDVRTNVEALQSA